MMGCQISGRAGQNSTGDGSRRTEGDFAVHYLETELEAGMSAPCDVENNKRSLSARGREEEPGPEARASTI